MEREKLAADIKGISLDEQARQKQSSKTRDPVDHFAHWHERFLHELASEFGPLPDGFEDEKASPEVIDDYIKSMKKQFRLRLR